jgi:nucleoside-diphosphate-sugar epimerase
LNTVLIVGATGLIGQAALEHFTALPDWKVVAISRRTPELPTQRAFRHLPLDLTDTRACREAAAQLREVTHVIYTAVAEKPGLVQGWLDVHLMHTNLGMFAQLLNPLCETARGLRHVTLLQGAKAYGAHAGWVMPLPAREQAARVSHENFYWLQEDHLRATATTHGFSWTIFRPQVVVGAAWGAAMNPLLALGAYAAIRHAERQPFSFPGGALQVGELVDAQLLAEAFQWAAESPNARQQTFNITNGDVFAWREAWPILADAFGLPVGAAQPLRLAEYLPSRSAIWDELVVRERLRPLTLAQFVGESHHYADILLRPDAPSRSRPALLSTIKLRLAGFSSCRDSEACVRRWIAELQDRRLLPTRVAQI